MKLLIIEDHPRVRENIIAFFRMHMHTAEWAWNGEEWLKKALSNEYDIIILDMSMPEMNGETFLRKLREEKKHSLVLVATSSGLLDDKELMYGLWADDFIVKPFELKELLLRANALQRRKWWNILKEVFIWDFHINIEQMKVYKNNTPISIPAKELKILIYLAWNRWVPKSKGDILQYVWWEKEENLLTNTMTLEVHIANIRKTLWKDIIKTVRSIGYVLWDN